MKIKMISEALVTSFIVALVAPCLSLMPTASAAVDTCTWSGGGADDNWTTSGNWTGCDGFSGVPEAGDSLVFPMTVAAADRTNVNDYANGTSFGGIQFTGTNSDCSSPSYVLSGNSITLTGNVTYDATGGCPVQLSFDIVAGANFDFVNNSAGDYTNIVVLGPPDGSGTLDLGSHTVGLSALNSNISTVLNYTLSGSGTLALTGPGLIDLYDGSMQNFTGNINLKNGNYYLTSTLFGTSAGSTTVDNEASLIFMVCKESGGNTDVGEELNFAGTFSDTSIPRFKVRQTSCTGGGSGAGGGADVSYGMAVDNELTVNFTSAITLNTDITFGSVIKNTLLSGSLNGSYKISMLPVYPGKLTISANPNTSGTANSVYVGEAEEATLSDDSSSTSIALFDNSIISVTGKRGATYIYGGTLKGTGTLGSIDMSSGKIAPGLSPGCLNSGNLAYTGGSLEIELGGTTACTGYDQQVVTGTVSLSTATTLTVSIVNGFTPKPNDKFTIISNDGSDAVTGNFSGLAEGATLTLGSYTFTISYKGGDGNDVVLTVSSAPSTTAAAGVPDTGVGGILSSPITTIAAALSIAAMLAGYRVYETKKVRK